MRGRLPKPPEIRQNRTKKAGRATIEAPEHPEVPEIPNPDQRVWHVLTLESWQRAWASPMASQWLDSDVDGLGRVAVLWDEFYKEPKTQMLAEIRLQEQRFGLSPLDRTRLQWEVARTTEAERKQQPQKRPTSDPRKVLRMAEAG